MFLIKDTTMMSVEEIANRLCELCTVGQFDTAMQELYSENAISIEADGTPPVEGLQNLFAKSQKMAEAFEEIHENRIGKPIVAGKYFAVTMWMDVTIKGMGRITQEEICLYKVEDGKVVSEQFFY